MKVYLSKHHILTSICGVPYLLPYGQGIVDYERQLKLNGSAAGLWIEIEELLFAGGLERDELAAGLCESYSDMPLSDACDFIDTLIDAGALSYEYI